MSDRVHILFLIVVLAMVIMLMIVPPRLTENASPLEKVIINGLCCLFPFITVGLVFQAMFFPRGFTGD